MGGTGPAGGEDGALGGDGFGTPTFNMESSVAAPTDMDVARTLELKRYPLQHRTWTHLTLTVKRNMRLKARRPLGSVCEVLWAPLFMCLLIMGLGLADTFQARGDSFMEREVINMTSFVQEVACLKNRSEALPNPLGLRACNISLFPVLELPDEDGGQVFVTTPTKPLPEGISITELTNLVQVEQPTTLINFDAYVLFQRTAVAFLGQTRERNDRQRWRRAALEAVFHSGSLEFATGDGVSCATAQRVIDAMARRWMMFSSVYNASRSNNPSCPGVWSDEDAAVAHATSVEGANTMWALVVLDAADEAAKKLDFTIRMNITATPQTKRLQGNLTGLGAKPHQTYMFSGFMSLETAVTAAFMGDGAAVWDHPDTIVQSPMPYPSFEVKEFYQKARRVIPLFLSFSFSLMVSRLVSALVAEKEDRQREGLLIMGLTRNAFFGSWYLTYCLVTTISSILVSFIGFKLFANTSAVLVFALFWCYGQALIAMSMLFSTVFSRARIAAVVSPILLMVAAAPKFMLDGKSTLTMDYGLCFLAPGAFAFGMDIFCDGESYGVGTGWKDLYTRDLSLAWVLAVLILDTVLYIVLARYLENVLPGEWGVHRHPLYFLPCFRKPKVLPPPEGWVTPAPVVHEQQQGQAADSSSSSSSSGGGGVHIQRLSKRFPGKDTPAVDGLGTGLPGDQLTFKEGQIQVILGHNGAGKTTTINLLTGMLRPDSGDCTIFGKSILSDMGAIREDLGLCPQHNILWADLTCREHLRYFGALKGVPDKDGVLDDLVVKMLILVNLGSKADSYARQLSGGQKRKLSVAIALIGGPKLVFLDEPTAGMDVESRRAMWQLLRKPSVLKDRCIVLTTHYMDEADILGDSVAIMDRGHLHSLGSPFYLKQKLGAGYNLSIVMHKGCPVYDIIQTVQKRVPKAKYLSASGNELRLQLPLYNDISDDAVVAAPGVTQATRTQLLDVPAAERVDHIVSAIKLAGPGDMLDSSLTQLQMVDRSTSSLGGGGEAAGLHGLIEAARAQGAFPALFEALEELKEAASGGIEGFGIGVITLEEIFMKIAMQGTIDTPSSPSKVPHTQHAGSPRPSSPAQSSPAKDVVGAASAAFKLYSITDEANPPVNGWALTFTQFAALFRKRVWVARRDLRTIVVQFVLPVVFILFALWLADFPLPAQPSLGLDASQYDASPFDVPVAYPASGNGTVPSLFAECDTDAQAEACPFYDAGYLIRPTGGDTSAGLNTFLGDTRFAHEGVLRAFALADQDAIAPDRVFPRPDVPATTTTTVIHNATVNAGLPTAVAAVLDATAKTRYGAAAGVRVSNHPFPISKYLEQLLEGVQVLVSSLVILLPFTVVPSNYVSFVVRERENKAKTVQLISGVKLSVYWAASFVFDLCAFAVTTFLCLCVFFAFGRAEFVGDASTAFATMFLFFTYGVASIASSYAGSFLFEKHTVAQTTWCVLNFLGGFVLVITSYILTELDDTRDTNNALKYLYRLFPSYCLGNGIMQMSLGSGQVAALNVYYGRDVISVWDWDGIMAECTFMLLTAPVYGLIIFAAEKGPRWWRQRRQGEEPVVRSNSGSEVDDEMPLVRNGGFETDGAGAGDDGADVAREREDVLSGAAGDCSVVVKNLRKVWPVPTDKKVKVAVDDITFGVRRGELFAFLGTNGAGKTTTISVLSGEVTPTSGSATIDGFDVVSNLEEARRHLGLCPQFDALLDQMNADEHLQMYADLRGIPKPQARESIETLIAAFGLEDHRRKPSKALSGGNRRKLSVAISLIGGPSVVFLDEPSAGMDPVARRGLWGALEDACQDRSVVLTTHHLEEVEGLSHLPHRVSIMVDARLQCIGSLQQLKSRHGDAYELALRGTSVAAEARIRAFVSKTYPRSTLAEATNLRLTYKIPLPLTLSSVFREIEGNRRTLGIGDYSISETSLEQVFIRISERAQRDDEGIDAMAAEAAFSPTLGSPPTQMYESPLLTDVASPMRVRL